MNHAIDCDLDEDCTCGASCAYCAGSGEAWDPQTGEGPTCPACGGTGSAMNEEIKRLIEDAARRLNVNVERMSVTAGTAGGVVWWEAQVRATGRIAGSVTPRIEAWSSGETIEQALDSLSLSFEPIGRAR